jgi:pyrimidine deaminase RibD-like protein
MLFSAQKKNPEHFGLVAACVVDPMGRRATGINHIINDGKRVHAERDAVRNYEQANGPLPEGSMVVTTLSPCVEPMSDRHGISCSELMDDLNIRKVYCGYLDPTQDTHVHNNYECLETQNEQLKSICKEVADCFLKRDITEAVQVDKVSGIVPAQDYTPSKKLTNVTKRVNSKDVVVDIKNRRPDLDAQTYTKPKKLKEITTVPTVSKSKRQHLDVMPNDGKPIPKGEEEHYLGKFVAKIGHGLELWSWMSHGTVTYYVFDTNTRTSHLGTTGRPYTTNSNSFVVQGVYSGPNNQLRAADLYAFLILNQGLILVSDNKQSEGGYRVWQELERRYKNINVHGFDTKTNKGVNVTTQDEPDTHVDRAEIKKAGPHMKRELGSISRDLRFVASKK